jgi:hypothetical protein
MEVEMDNCPKCKISLIGAPIPQEDRELFGGASNFRREIGIYDQRKDMTVAYECPDCGFRWGRIVDFPNQGTGYRTTNQVIAGTTKQKLIKRLLESEKEVEE